MALQFGLFIPPFGELAEPRRLVDLAQSAERAGWSGFFLWDHMLAFPGMPVADPWTLMGAVACSTDTMRIGMLVTPLARRRPWVLARQAATLDRLSGGRFVVGVGLGDDGWGEFSSFKGEETDLAGRAQIVDESLDLLQQFWSGHEVHTDGTHLSVDSPPFLPRPLQDPLPVWVACRWPHRRPLARAARHQGCFPLFDPGGRTVPGTPDPADVASARAALISLGAAPDIDIVCRGVTDNVPLNQRSTVLTDLEAAGMTWWLESFGAGDPPAQSVERTVLAGPPRP